jgi:hypothetical protein
MEKIKKRVCYPLSALESAKNAVKSQSMSQYRAAKEFNVPRSTLHDKLNEKYSGGKPGKKPIFTESEEGQLSDFIVECAERGYPLTRARVLCIACEMLQIKSDGKAVQPGAKWFKGFLRRNPGIATRTAQKVSRASAVVSENNIRDWHKQIEHYFTENDLMHILENHPERLFNCDESGFQLVPEGNKVLAKRGARNVLEVAHGQEKQSVTAMFAISAAGTLIPPLMIYKNSYKMLEIARKMPRKFHS